MADPEVYRAYIKDFCHVPEKLCISDFFSFQLNFPIKHSRSNSIHHIRLFSILISNANRFCYKKTEPEPDFSFRLAAMLQSTS